MLEYYMHSLKIHATKATGYGYCKNVKFPIHRAPEIYLKLGQKYVF